MNLLEAKERLRDAGYRLHKLNECGLSGASYWPSKCGGSSDDMRPRRTRAEYLKILSDEKAEYDAWKVQARSKYFKLKNLVPNVFEDLVNDNLPKEYSVYNIKTRGTIKEYKLYFSFDVVSEDGYSFQVSSDIKSVNDYYDAGSIPETIIKCVKSGRIKNGALRHKEKLNKAVENIRKDMYDLIKGE